MLKIFLNQNWRSFQLNVKVWQHLRFTYIESGSNLRLGFFRKNIAHHVYRLSGISTSGWIALGLKKNSGFQN